MSAKRMAFDLVCIVGGGLAGTSIGFHLAGDVGATIGAIGGMLVGLGVSTWHQIPR